MASSAIWIAVATLIAALDITKAVDENGDIIEADPEYVSSLVWYVIFLMIELLIRDLQYS